MTNKMDDLNNNGLTGLQNKFREMESQIRITNDDSVQTIKMQRQKISKLREDNARIKDELELETRQARRSLDKKGRSDLSLQDQGDFYARKIEMQKLTISELETNIRKIQSGILQQRSDMGGVNANRETSKTIQKNIRMLENRLDKALVKYNEALGHNKKLRETIDNLRRDRSVFDGIYAKLQSDLETKKNQMGKIMEDAMCAYEARVNAQVEMIKLKDQADKEMKFFDKEWMNLNTMIDENNRKNMKCEQTRNINSHSRVNDPIANEEKDLKQRLTKASMQVGGDKVEIQKLQENIKYYRSAFEQIRNYTEIESIDDLINKFEEAEKNNFKLFNESNNLDIQLECLEERVQELQNEIKKTGDNEKNSDSQRNQILQSYQNRLENTEKKIGIYDKKQVDSMATVNSLTSGIHDILKCMNAERVDSNIMDRIDTVGINESNLMEYLAVIEKRTNDLIKEYLKLDDADKVDEFTKPVSIDQVTAVSAGMGIGVGEIENKLVIVPPTTLNSNDRSNIDDEENI